MQKNNSEFQNKDLSVIWYAAGATGFLYNGKQTLAQITADGFFQNIIHLIERGDCIYVVATDGVANLFISDKTTTVKTGVLNIKHYEPAQQDKQ